MSWVTGNWCYSSTHSPTLSMLFFFFMDCEAHHHHHTVKIRRLMVKARHSFYLLYLLDITGKTALEQWKHVAWLLSAEGRPSCEDYLNFKLLHNRSESFLSWSNKTSKFYFCISDCGVFLALQPPSTSSIKSFQSASCQLLYFAQSTIWVLLQILVCFYIRNFSSSPCFTWINIPGAFHESTPHTLGI